VHERRNVRRPPNNHKPELLATGPNRLCLLLTLRGRCLLQPLRCGLARGRAESAALAAPRIAETCRKQNISPKSSPYLPTAAAP
jgi:hypothetical protein